MNFFITGGAGFIGGHLTAALLSQGHRVTVMDNYSTGSPRNLAPVIGNPLLTVLEDDILTAPALEKLIEKADVIYHLAAAVGVELVVHDPVRTIRTNVEGSARVLELAAKYRRRVILASTSEVYGKSTHPEFNENDDLLIGCPVRSRWSYACSKLLDEFYLMAYYRNMGLPGTVVRFFNTVGPRQTGQYGMVVPRFVKAAISGQPLKVYGSGAGKLPTASAVVADVIEVAKHQNQNIVTIWSSKKLTPANHSEMENSFFVRVPAADADKAKEAFGDIAEVSANVAGEFAFVTKKMSEAIFEEKAACMTVLNRIRTEWEA